MTQLALTTACTAPARIETPVGWYLEDYSDFEFKLVITGRIVPKKNHLKPIRIGSRGSIATDSDYNRWERHAWMELRQQWSSVFSEPLPKHIELNLAVVSYFDDLRSWPDLSATYEGPQDVLEAHRSTCDLTVGKRNGLPKCKRHAGVITNDRQVCTHHDSDRILDRDIPPRVEIYLTPRRRTPWQR